MLMPFKIKKSSIFKNNSNEFKPMQLNSSCGSKIVFLLLTEVIKLYN